MMPISDASSFQDTLERLRQRYALHFYWPDGATDPEGRTVVVNLAHSTGARYSGSEVRYRRAYLSSARAHHAGGLIEVSREADPTDPQGARSSRPALAAANSRSGAGGGDVGASQAPVRRRAAVNERSGPLVNAVDVESDDTPERKATPQTSTSTDTGQASPAPEKRTGWPRVDEPKGRPNQGGPPDK